MNIWKLVRSIFVKIIGLLVLLAVVNFFCCMFISNYKSYRQSTKDVNHLRDNRWRLPNYDNNRETAKEIFKDFESQRIEYKPFTGWSRLPYQGKTTSINEQGDRYYQPIGSTGNGKIVRFVGGSTMWGTGSVDSNTIPAYFNRLHPDYVVYNHGESSYNTRLALAKLINLYVQGEPTDIVIFYSGTGDPYYQCLTDAHSFPNHKFENKLREFFANTKPEASYVKSLKAVLFDCTYKVFREVRDMIFTQPQQPKSESKDCINLTCHCDLTKAEKVADMMVNSWETAHQIVTANGGQFIAILQPIAFLGKPKLEHLERYLKHKQEQADNYRAVYTIVQRKIKERNYPWMLDFTAAFDIDEYIYLDDGHVSKRGNEIIAARIDSIVRHL